VFGATFLVFSDYMRPAIRLAAMMRRPIIYVMTHDSIAVGEDGPTHEPVEHLASLRCIPGLITFRPADATETVGAYEWAMSQATHPVAMALSRQNLPVLATTDATKTKRGAYVIDDCDKNPDVVLIATGSEVHVAMAVKRSMNRQYGNMAIRVVSMPSWELFEHQSRAYKISVIDPNAFAVSIEMAHPQGWGAYAEMSFGITKFGASAPGDTLIRQYGFGSEDIAHKIFENLFSSPSEDAMNS